MTSNTRTIATKMAKSRQNIKEQARRQALPEAPFPANDLDSEITSVLSSLPASIDKAIEVQEAAIRFKVFKRQTQGWSILVASWTDFYSDMVINNRTFSNLGGLTTVYRYGFIVFYGIGFGFPYLLAMPDPVLSCSSSDFTDVIGQYQLSNGLNDLFAANLSITCIKSLIGEFDSLVRQRLSCILKYEGSIIEASEVVFSLDQLRVLLNLRADCQTDLTSTPTTSEPAPTNETCPTISPQFVLANFKNFVKLVQSDNETNLDTLLRLQSQLISEKQISPLEEQPTAANISKIKPDFINSAVLRESQSEASIETNIISDSSNSLEHELRRNKVLGPKKIEKEARKAETFNSFFTGEGKASGNPVNPKRQPPDNTAENADGETNSITEEILKSKKARSAFIQNREDFNAATILDLKGENMKVDVTSSPNDSAMSGAQNKTLIKLDLIPEVFEPKTPAASLAEMSNHILRSTEVPISLNKTLA